MLAVKFVFFLLYFKTFFNMFQTSTYYLITERPVIQLINPKYVSYFNVTSRRYGRRNPMYYVNMHFTSLRATDNNVSIDIYFYEYIYNQYRRSLLEFHFKWCNLFHHDMFFALTLRRALPPICPLPAGTYHLYNMTLNADAIPEAFPFTKGRMLINTSYLGEPIGSGYADLELKKYKKPK